MKRLRDRADARRRLVAGMLRLAGDSAGELTMTLPLAGLPPAVEVGRALRGLTNAVADSQRPLLAVRVHAFSPDAESLPGQIHVFFDNEAGKS